MDEDFDPDPSDLISTVAEYKGYIERQLGNTDASKELNDLSSTVKHIEKMDIKQQELDELYWKNLTKNFDQEELTKHLLDTDYVALYGTSKEDWMEYKNKHIDIYNRAKPYIKQMVKGINRPENQVGKWVNNAKGVAWELKLKGDAEDIIDKLISIEAMNKNDSWKMIEELEGEGEGGVSILDDIMMEMKDIQNRQIKEFKKNPDTRVKGWMDTPYKGDKKVNEQGMIEVDYSAANQQGIIPSKEVNKQSGKKIMVREDTVDGEKMVPLNMKRTKANIEIALKNNWKIDKWGNVFAMAGQPTRDKLGRSRNFSKIIAGTTRKMKAKGTEILIVEKILDGEYGNIYSSTKKEGMVQVPESQTRKLPKVLQEKMKYVNEKYYFELFGKKKYSFTNESNSKLAQGIDKALRDLTSDFKKNVVLKNIPSYVNAFLASVTTPIMIGRNPARAIKDMHFAMKEAKRNNELILEKAHYARLGINPEFVIDKLQESLLYQLEENGLATNLLDGAKEGTSFIGNAIGKIFGRYKRVNTLVNNVMLNDGSYMGNKTAALFSFIDTGGRYTTALKVLEGKEKNAEGKYSKEDLQEAVLYANGLFGDMSRVAPDVITMLDGYPIAPFIKWASQVAPMTLKLTKNKPQYAFPLMVGLYMLQEESKKWGKDDKDSSMRGGIRTSSYNPVFTILDFAQDIPEESIFRKWEYFVNEKKEGKDVYNALKPYLLPRYITKIAEQVAYNKDKEKVNYGRLAKETILPKAGHKFKTNKGTEIDTRAPTMRLIERIMNDEDTMGKRDRGK